MSALSTDENERPDAAIGFRPEEVDTAAPTRSARLKWVIVVDSALPAGRAVNAAACVAASARIRERAAGSPDVFVADMPVSAQLTRVYDEYLAAVAAQQPEEIGYAAVGLVGPRNRVDRIVGRLPLL